MIHSNDSSSTKKNGRRGSCDVVHYFKWLGLFAHVLTSRPRETHVETAVYIVNIKKGKQTHHRRAVYSKGSKRPYKVTFMDHRDYHQTFYFGSSTGLFSTLYRAIMLQLVSHLSHLCPQTASSPPRVTTCWLALTVFCCFELLLGKQCRKSRTNRQRLTCLCN